MCTAVLLSKCLRVKIIECVCSLPVCIPIQFSALCALSKNKNNNFFERSSWWLSTSKRAVSLCGGNVSSGLCCVCAVSVRMYLFEVLQFSVTLG